MDACSEDWAGSSWVASLPCSFGSKAGLAASVVLELSLDEPAESLSSLDVWLDELSVGVSVGFTVSDSFSSDLAVSETGFSTFPWFWSP